MPASPLKTVYGPGFRPSLHAISGDGACVQIESVSSKMHGQRDCTRIFSIPATTVPGSTRSAAVDTAATGQTRLSPAIGGRSGLSPHSCLPVRLRSSVRLLQPDRMPCRPVCCRTAQPPRIRNNRTDLNLSFTRASRFVLKSSAGGRVSQASVTMPARTGLVLVLDS